MRLYDAFLFDMNGTMIDDMKYHEGAWYDILVNRLKADLTREQVKHHIYGKNEEMIERVFGAGRFSKEEIDVLACDKEAQYRKDFLPDLKLIKGLDSFLAKAVSQHIKMAIGTAANVPNVDFVLDNLDIRGYFPVIVSADDVAFSKPHPEVFLKAAELLGIAPERCVVFEDSPKGIEAARRAGMKAVGIASYHAAAELQNENLLFVVDDYTDILLDQLFK
jgi:HAD superfamily hydrolase (TIGR01509 family)